MFKKLGWAALLVTFFAAPAMAQPLPALVDDPRDVGDAVDFIPGKQISSHPDGGYLCGAEGLGGAGDNTCDGVQLEIQVSDEANVNIENALNTTTYTWEILVNVETGVVWEDTMLAAVDPVASPVTGGRGQTTQDLIDAENAIQHLEALADEASGAAQKLEIESNTACAGVPLTLRHILCPQLL
jgi:hypothetical protein